MKRRIKLFSGFVLYLFCVFLVLQTYPVFSRNGSVKAGEPPAPFVSERRLQTLPGRMSSEVRSQTTDTQTAVSPVTLWAATTFTIGQNFTGNNPSVFIPPDTMGAVGPNHIVQTLNGRYVAYDKTGVLQQTSTLDEFWANAGVPPINYSFDPRIVYDKYSDRWFAAAVDNGGTANNFLVAVSSSNDPTAGWTGFAIDADTDNTHWADFPMLGVNQNVVVIVANMFPISNGSDVAHVLVLPKSDLTAAVPSVANHTLFEDIALTDIGFAAQPVFDQDNGTLPLSILSAYNKPAGLLKISSIGGPVSAPILNTTGGLIAVTARNVPPDIDQPGTKVDIDTGDNRFSGNVIQQQIPGRTNPSLWGVHSVAIAGRAAVEWYEIDAVTNAVIQSGIISDTALAFNYPSIAVNNTGDVVIGLSGGSPGTFMSTYVAVGHPNGGATTFSAPVQIRAGVSDYEQLDGTGRNRWGDYSATVVDPSDDQHFWTFQEFVSSTDRWGIQITEIIIAARDYGDLPDTSAATGPGDYQTINTGSGPYHVVTDTLRIGATIDADSNGQPTATADGDDIDGIDDEDGVTMPGSLSAGQTAVFTVTVTNTSGTNAILYSFADWNKDGDFNDMGEAVTQPVVSGTVAGAVNVNFTVPLTATAGSSLGVRFRFSTDTSLDATGAASNGEMEDYLVTVDPCTITTMHTVVIDGSLADWCANTELLQSDTRPIIGTQDLYTTWDATHIYIAWDGSDWNSDGDLWVYFYATNSVGTTTSVNGAHTLPIGITGGGVDYALVVTDTLNAQLYNWNGSNWAAATFNGTVSSNSRVTEIGIPRTDINIPSGASMALLAFAESEGANTSWASFPTVNPIGTAFTQAIQWGATGTGVTPNNFSVGGNGPTAVSLQTVTAVVPKRSQAIWLGLLLGITWGIMFMWRRQSWDR